MQLYTLLYVTVDGALLCEENSVTVNRSTNSQAVVTVAKGYAGESPGAATTEIDVKNAVPSSDFELDPGPFMKQLRPAEIGVSGPGGKRLKAKGFIINDTIEHSANSESGLSFKFRGQWADWE